MLDTTHTNKHMVPWPNKILYLVDKIRVDGEISDGGELRVIEPNR